MPDKIDYKFLSDLEGGCKTVGYVPAAAISKSGVTIATGFDLGQRSMADLNNLKLPASLVSKLKPYLGKKGKTAAEYLRKNPLLITAEQGKKLDRSVKITHIKNLQTRYLASAHNESKIQLFDTPAEAQTVIASVSFQYGVNLASVTPKFWKAISSQDWKNGVEILKKFGDVYPTRRNKEATLLSRIVK